MDKLLMFLKSKTADRLQIFLKSQALVIIILWWIFLVFWVPNFFWNWWLDDRILENQNEQISFTWNVLSLSNLKDWNFLIKSKLWNEFFATSKSLDLENFSWWDVFLEGEITFNKVWKKIFDVKKIVKIEKKIIKDPKEFFLENKYWWYWFLVDEKVFSHTKWGSKTLLRNLNWEVILKLFSFDFKNINLFEWWFFSEWWEKFTLEAENWEISWEKKDLKNGQEIFLKNKRSNQFQESYWVLIQIDYWKTWNEYFNKKWKDKKIWNKNKDNLKNLKQEISKLLKTFYFTQKVKISKKKCWWKENVMCKTWYFCELFSDEDDANWRCVAL